MKRMISPALSTTSLTTPFRRSSNSPWYFAPAIRAPISREYITLLLRFSGTSPSTILRAIPSEIAVLPTPGSPTRIGLFFVLRLSIWRTRRISSSLPMTGSSFPADACSLRFTAYLGRNCSLLFVFSIMLLLFLISPRRNCPPGLQIIARQAPACPSLRPPSANSCRTGPCLPRERVSQIKGCPACGQTS